MNFNSLVSRLYQWGVGRETVFGLSRIRLGAVLVCANERCRNGVLENQLLRSRGLQHKRMLVERANAPRQPDAIDQVNRHIFDDSDRGFAVTASERPNPCRQKIRSDRGD